MTNLISKAKQANLFFRHINCFNYKYFSKDSYSIKETMSVVTPHVNLDCMIDERVMYESNLSKRGHHENFDELIILWKSYKSLLEEKSTLEEKREANRLSIIKDKSNVNIDNLKTIGKNIREDLKKKSGKITHLENTLIPRVLSLPNSLSSEVGDSQVVIKNFLEPTCNEYDHLSVGKHLDVLEYIDSYSYSFKDIAAKYELAICRSIVNRLCDFDFIRMSNPDFSRISLIKGWIDGNPNKHIMTLNKSFQTGKDGLYLNGGAHFLMFCALFVNSIVDSGNLPMKYVCQGRSYSPASNEFLGLYNVVQSTSVNFFVGTDETSSSIEFENITNIIWQFYKSLGIPIRLVYSPISDLIMSESTRISIQVFSPFNNKYFEVGNVCKTNDFVSKRLRMYYKCDNDLKFIHIIHGNVIKVPILLACLLETHPDQFLLTSKQHLKLFK